MSPPLLPQDITMTSETEETMPKGLFYREARDTSEAAWGLRYILRQIHATDGYRPNIGQTTLATSALEIAIAALSRAPEAEELGGSTRMTSPASRSQTPLSAGWQDISTAPKDGTPFTSQDRANYGQREFTGTRWYTHPSVAGWITDDLDCGDNEFEPTHWMLSGAQRSELTRLAQDEPALSPPSTGGEGEAVAWQVRGDGQWATYGTEASAISHAKMFLVPYEIRPLFAHPSPEMGEISRDELEAGLNKVLRLQVDALIGEVRTLVPQNYGGWDYHGRHWTDRIAKRATDQILKLKENGLSREELGGDQPAPVVRGQGPNPVLTDGPLSDGGEG